MTADDDRRADEAAARLDHTFPVAVALADALKVITSLGRTTSHTEPDGMKTGEGYAAGHEVVDDTLPDLAQHLRELIEHLQADTELVRAALEPLHRADHAAT